MFKRKLNNGDYLLIATNLIPLLGVWFMGWDPMLMFLVYVCETIIIGLYNVLKMLMATWVKKKDIWENNGSRQYVSGYFFILFFVVHYGFFVFVQMFLFFGASGIADKYSAIFGSVAELQRIWQQPGIYALLSFIIMYGIRTIHDFILTGEYRETSLMRLMFSPYLRIFVQQFVVIAGSIFLRFGGGKIFMLIFVFVKVFFEIYINFDRALNVYEKKMRIEDDIERKKREN